MVLTIEFRNILRRNKRNLGEDKALKNALLEAEDLGIIPFRERKKRGDSFKKQKNATELSPNFI